MTNAITSFSKKVDEQLMEPLRQVLKGRKIVKVTPEKGFHITSVDWSKVVDVSDGMVSYAFTSGNEDSIDLSLTNSKIPLYWKDYTLDRRLYEAFLANGTDVDAASAISAGYKAAKAEDAAIIMGVSRDGTNYDLNGLYQGAGNDYSTSKDFGTNGNAVAALGGALALMAADDVPTDSLDFNMILHPTQYNQLLVSTNSTSGRREWEDIMSMLGDTGMIMQSSALADGTGLVGPTESVGEPYADFYLTKDFGTEHGFDSKHPETGPLTGRVYSAGVLRIKQNVAYCKLSSI